MRAQFPQLVPHDNKQDFGWLDTQQEKKVALQLVDKLENKSEKVFLEIDKVHTKVFICMRMRGFMATVTVVDNKKTIEVVEVVGDGLKKKLEKE